MNHCRCADPQPFEGDETCFKCGRTVRGVVSRRSLEIVLSQIALEHTRLPKTAGKAGQPRKG